MAQDEVEHRDSPRVLSGSAGRDGIGVDGDAYAGLEREPVASDARRDPLIGTRVNGKFHIHSAIARGGMGRVYYATQMPLDRPVALKVVESEGDHARDANGDASFFKRFLREASILAKLQHPNVVTLYDYGAIEGGSQERYFIAMEYLAGETLAERLANRLQLGVAETVLMARQILRGLREAHSRGIVHRDLKPSNIILVPDHEGGETVKLVDFGIGKVLDKPNDVPDLTQSGAFMGTPRYMAPEQFEGEAAPASDLYALGTILYQALSGELPFRGATMTEFMVAKLTPKPIPQIRDMFPMSDVTERFEALVRRMLSHLRGERPSTEEAIAALAVCEEELFGAPRTALSHKGPFSSRSSIKQAPRLGSSPSLLEGPSTRASSTNETLRSEAGASWFKGRAPASSGTGPNLIDPTAISAGSPAKSAPGPDPSLGPRSLQDDVDPLPKDPTPRTEQAERAPVTENVTAPREPQDKTLTAAPDVTSSARDTRTSERPASSRRSNVTLLIAAGIAIAGVAFGLVARESGKGDRATVAPTEIPTVTPPASNLPAIEAPATATTNTVKTGRGSERSFTLTIDSSPLGASVLEGDLLLGTTPLQFTIDRASVKEHPRTFSVAKDGYVTTRVVQGPSDENVRTVVALASDPRHKPAAVKPTATAPRAGDGGEIRLER